MCDQFKGLEIFEEQGNVVYLVRTQMWEQEYLLWNITDELTITSPLSTIYAMVKLRVTPAW